MGYPLAVLKRVMTWAEFIGWCEFYEVEPFDDRRADRSRAQTAMVLANVHRDTKRRAQPFTARDFMPYEPMRELSTEELERQILEDF